ncbi:MAG: site-specific integrase, partial [Magnetococcales bacterium]|nr:site-specific integrase [Magnetococcales bacterium]
MFQADTPTPSHPGKSPGDHATLPEGTEPGASAILVPHGDLFLRHLVLRRHSPHTIAAYRRDLNHFAAFWRDRHQRVLTDADLPVIDKEDMRAFMGMAHRTGLARSTQQRRIASIRAWYHFLEREGWV